MGACKLHGGSVPSHLKKSWSTELQRTLGREFEIDPINALMWLIRLAAGDVLFWSQEIQDMQAKAREQGKNAAEALIDKSNELLGRQLDVAGKEYNAAQERLAKFSKMALDVGIADRAVRVAEMYGEMLYTLIMGIMNDLIYNNPLFDKNHHYQHLRNQIRDQAAQIVPKHLLALDTLGMPNEEAIEAEWRELAS